MHSLSSNINVDAKPNINSGAVYSNYSLISGKKYYIARFSGFTSVCIYPHLLMFIIAFIIHNVI